MAVYRSSLGGAVGTNYRQKFFDTLVGCLASICRDGSISMVSLAPPVDPAEKVEDRWTKMRNPAYERDEMLLRNGAPLLAVFLRYRSSAGPENIPGEPGDADYADAPSYAGGSIREVQHALGARLRAAVPSPAPEAPPKPTFNEGRWTMVLRALDMPEPLVFIGHPLDIDAIDGAFTVLVDQLVARISALTTPQPQKA